MAIFGIELAEDRRVTLRFEKFPGFAHDRLLAALQRIEQRLHAAVLAETPVRTGALKAQIGSHTYDHGARIAAVVGVRDKTARGAKKATALEYGAKKPMIVKAHEAKLSHVYGRLISPIMVTIPAHQRTPNITARRFLRGPVQAIRSSALAELQAAMEQATRDAEG